MPAPLRFFRRAFVACLLVLVVAPSARAQTVEFEIPTSIEVAEGRLSVTFADTVSEATATAFVAAHGHAVESVGFHAVNVQAAADAPLPPEVVQRLEADPRVLSVNVKKTPEALADAVISVDERGFDAEDLAAYSVVFSLAPTLTPSEARKLAAAVPGVFVQRIRKLPNDLVVSVAGDVEEALRTIEASPLVAYVTYVAEEG